MFHLGHVFGRRHQEENRIQVALFRNDSVFAQEVGKNRGGNAEVGIVSRFSINARGGEQQLARVDEVLAFSITFEVVPLSFRFEFEEA